MNAQQKIKDTPPSKIITVKIGVLDIQKFKDLIDDSDFMIMIEQRN